MVNLLKQAAMRWSSSVIYRHDNNRRRRQSKLYNFYAKCAWSVNTRLWYGTWHWPL
jgi:hypothetical protein